ncbi:MAG: hypothetical protein SOT28_04515 [Fusicatenibacter sp.]|nr:hypothetical protein [Lachnospiraceae bacterium]MDY2937566.1 hypothetical protein [Fusicatenibacter sp.]
MEELFPVSAQKKFLRVTPERTFLLQLHTSRRFAALTLSGNGKALVRQGTTLQTFKRIGLKQNILALHDYNIVSAQEFSDCLLLYNPGKGKTVHVRLMRVYHLSLTG